MSDIDPADEVKPAEKALPQQDLMDRLTLIEERLSVQTEDIFDAPVAGAGPMDEIPEWLPGGGGGGGGVTQFRIYTKGGIISFTYADATEDYDPSPAPGAAHTDWSVEFVVSNSVITGLADPMGVPTMDVGGEELYDGDASADPVETQDYYRLAIVRGGKVVCQGGVYRENIFCAGSRGPIVELVRIG